MYRLQRYVIGIMMVGFMMVGTNIFASELPVVCHGKNIDGNFLAPMRVIFEGLGCGIEWIEETQTIIARNNNTEVKLVVDSNIAYVNGVKKQLPVSPKVINGNTYIPIRFIAESFNKELRWLNNLGCAVIELNPNDRLELSRGDILRIHNDYILIAPEIKGKISKPMLKQYEYERRSFWDNKYNKNLEIKSNSADGITLIWNARNNTGKEIKYFTLNLRMINRVGDPAYCKITGKSRFNIRYVGGIKPNESLGVWDLFAYSGTCDSVVIDSIKLEYMNGTSETVKYGYTATPYIIE